MPIINVGGVRRMSAMNRTEIPASLNERLEAAPDGETVVAIGVEVATDLCERLLAGGVAGVHLYAMNRSESVRRVFDNLARPTS
jgi:methylenetetrahydrofolate reductase (NADPH)